MIWLWFGAVGLLVLGVRVGWSFGYKDGFRDGLRERRRRGTE